MPNIKLGFRLAGIMTLLLLLIGVAAPFALAAGSISGSVTKSADAAPIQGVTINVYDSNWNLVTSGASDALGNYSIPSIAAGSYKLRSYNTDGYVDEFYTSWGGVSNRGSAGSVTVAESTDTPNINFILATGAGSISGTVSQAIGGSPLVGITVIVMQGNDSYWSVGTNYVAWTTTGASGEYYFPGLGFATNYVVKTVNTLGYADEYYSNQYLYYLPNPVTVMPSTETANIDFALSVGGTISGRVTSESTGNGISGVSVRAIRGIDFGFAVMAKLFYTDADGYYQVTQLPPGYYFVEIPNAGTLGYRLEVYDNNHMIYGARAVPVQLGTITPNINFSLEPGASISGRVTNESSGAAISSAGLTLYDSDWVTKSFGSSDSSGNYLFNGLPPGSYYIEASPSGYAREKYNGAGTRGTATAVFVTQGAAVTGIDLSLVPTSTGTPGSISGTITAPSFTIINVQVYDTSWNSKVSTSATYFSTPVSYTISNLPPGQYYVGTSNVFGGVVAEKYYNNVALRSAAALVTVTAGNTTANINFDLAAGGSISGTVTRNGDGAPVPNAGIRVYDAEWVLKKTATTNISGVFSATGLPSGNYYLEAWGINGYINEIYNDVSSRGAATSVSVTEGVDTPNINFGLQPGYAISGNVTRYSDGSGLAGVTIQAYDLSWQNVMSAVTESNGAFYLEGIAPGEYYLKTSNSQGYIDRYFFNADHQSDAKSIYVPDDAVFEMSYAQFSLHHTMPAPANFDSDTKTDVTIMRPGSNVWYTMKSETPGSYTATRWGWAGDIAVPADFDGDDKMDIATWWPEGGYWFILPSSAPGTYTASQWGLPTDTPVPGDYDGDGKDDLAVWRPDSGFWYILTTSNPGDYRSVQWGSTGDIPVPRDYDGDGKIDIAVWRPGSGVWYIVPSESPGTYIATQWGAATDKPVPGDYDGDAKTDVAVWRPGDGRWYILPSNSTADFLSAQWGMDGDVPVPGDYDGDGKTDLAVMRPSVGTWYALKSSDPMSFIITPWGQSGDLPISSITGILQELP
jgi:hypothetical protein